MHFDQDLVVSELWNRKLAVLDASVLIDDDTFGGLWKILLHFYYFLNLLLRSSFIDREERLLGVLLDRVDKS